MKPWSQLTGIAGLVLGSLALPLCCARERPAAGTGRQFALTAFVSILPQAYVVERIGGNRVAVKVLLPPGQRPETYAPTAKRMAELARTDVYLRIGVPFENVLLPKIENTMKNLRVVDTRRGIQLRRMEETGGHSPCDGHHDDDDQNGHTIADADHHHHHHAGGDDPHVWLDPALVIRQAQTVHDVLAQLDPAGAAAYAVNFRALKTDLEAVYSRLKAALSPLRGREIFVYHPAYGYFADAFGLRQIAVETGGKKPSARQISRLIRMARDRNVRVIFVQPQFSHKSAEVIAKSIGGSVIALDPLAPDYIRNMEHMAEQINQALR